MDNYAAHKPPKVRTWLAANPRVHVHFPPTHVSWMNLLECGSPSPNAKPSIAPRTPASRTSTPRSAFVDGWNDRAHPFTWTKTGDQILVKANRKRTSNAGPQSRHAAWA